jgi:ABC-2 type transport system ATP-binding protein
MRIIRLETVKQAAVEVRDVTVVRGGREVLRGLNCSIATGQITGLVGPSGSGKTTLMRAIVGVQRNVSGDVIVLGQPAGSQALRQEVGYVTQAPSIYQDLSVHANVRYFGSLYGKNAAQIRAAIDAVGLSDHASTIAGSLSGGQFSRVSLACALVTSPKLLILDEPTVGLDPVLRAELWAYFDSLAAAGMTLLVSSHVMDEAARCSSILLLRDGALLAALTPDQLRQRTGADDLDSAFLRLIQQHEVAA